MADTERKNARRSYVDGVEPCLVDEPAAAAPAVDPDEVFASVGEVPYEWRLDSDVIIWGRNAPDVLAVTDLSAIESGARFAEIVDPAGGQSRGDAVMRSTFQDGGSGVPYQVQYALRVPGRAGPLWIEDTGRWFAGQDGKPLRAHGVVRAINERHEREQRLAYLSQHDPLTGEMNRWRLTEVLGATIDDAIRRRSSCAFVLVAIDNLGRINDAYGFDIADEVIAGVAKRVRSQLRGQDHLGRFSGNKFGVILNNCTHDELPIAADRLLVQVRDEVLQTRAGPVAVTVTIGGVTAPRHARSVRDMLVRAQEALDSARSRRRGSFQSYQPNLEREGRRHENVRATDEIIRALNERRVSLVYEPIVEAGTRRPAWYECLMRVQRADGSLLPVNDVVRLAERLGLVRLLDHRVLELVLDELLTAPGLRASLNVSAASTVDPSWWGALATMLRAHGGIADRLMVEITETAAIQDIDETRSFVARVKDLGCRIAIDDFGAGYTSFRNLRKLGVDVLKIDGAFVHNLARSEDDRAFVRTLADLGRRLGIETVAEWVQDEQAAAILTAWGCDYLQGALTGRATTERPWLSDRREKIGSGSGARVANGG